MTCSPSRLRAGGTAGFCFVSQLDGHPPGLQFSQETNRTAKFLVSPAKAVLRGITNSDYQSAYRLLNSISGFQIGRCPARLNAQIQKN
jgi:hypothetical protein